MYGLYFCKCLSSVESVYCAAWHALLCLVWACALNGITWIRCSYLCLVNESVYAHALSRTRSTQSGSIWPAWNSICNTLFDAYVNLKWNKKKIQQNMLYNRRIKWKNAQRREKKKKRNTTDDDNKVMSERNIDDDDKKSLKINNEISTHSFTAVSFWVFSDTHTPRTVCVLFGF